MAASSDDHDASDDEVTFKDPHLIIYTADEVLRIGILLLGFQEKQLHQWVKQTSLDKFRNHFGIKPHIVAQIWEDLQTTDIDEARLDVEPAKHRSMDNFLYALHFLKRYDTEPERESR